ncbi:hypothetical protein IBTHAUMO2_640011 [Nitrosopumilaceae archaeon]|nr:hypothetical protein IBTHAUMO2_640011 [Nitrosopumilaceae archaeon]
MGGSVILVEYNTDLEKLMEIDADRIVTLDYVAHMNLRAAGVDHELIEDYIKPDREAAAADKAIREMSRNWHGGEAAQFTNHDGLDLGTPLEEYMMQYLAQVIKKFTGIARLVAEYSPDAAYCSGHIGLMIHGISPKVELRVLPIGSSSVAHFEDVRIPIRLGSRLSHVKVSRSTVLKMKKLAERTTGALVGNTGSKDSRILFLNFEVTAYEEMLSEFSKRYDIVMLNERRPVVWNLASLRAARRLGCTITSLDRHSDAEAASEIREAESAIDGKVDRLVGSGHLGRYFAISGMSFWPAISDEFTGMIRDRFKESARRFLLARRMFKRERIDGILLLYANSFEEKVILSAAEAEAIPATSIEHGYLPSRPYMERYRSIFLGSNPYCRNLVWGERSRDLLSDVPPHAAATAVGSPRHDEFFHVDNKSSKRIVLFDSFNTEVDLHSIDSRVLEKNEEMIKELCKELGGLPYDFAVKLHPGHHVLGYSLKPSIERASPGTPVHQAGDVMDFLAGCSLAVASAPTTVMLEAMIMRIPTLVCIPDGFWDKEDVFTTGASLLVHSYEEFRDVLPRVLDDEEFRGDLLSRSDSYVARYFSFPGRASQMIAAAKLD